MAYILKNNKNNKCFKINMTIYTTQFGGIRLFFQLKCKNLNHKALNAYIDFLKIIEKGLEEKKYI